MIVSKVTEGLLVAVLGYLLWTGRGPRAATRSPEGPGSTHPGSYSGRVDVFHQGAFGGRMQACLWERTDGVAAGSPRWGGVVYPRLSTGLWRHSVVTLRLPSGAERAACITAVVTGPSGLRLEVSGIEPAGLDA